MTTAITESTTSLFKGVQSVVRGYSALIKQISKLEDEQIIELYFYLDEIGSLNWRAKCACLWEAFQRLKGRKPTCTQKDVSNLGKEFHLASPTVYQYISVWDTFFADCNILEWKINEYSFFRLALSAPDPIEALQQAEEKRIANRNYTLGDFKRDVIRRKREQKLDSAILPDLENNKQVIHGDALEILPKLDSDLVNCIITDPPYFLTSEEMTSGSREGKGEWDVAKNYEEVHEFNFAWLTEAHRILKDDGSIFVMGSLHNIFNIGHIMKILDFYIIRDIIWEKPFTQRQPANRLVPAHETIIWARKGRSHTCNLDEIERDIWKIQGKHKFGHPTEKPEELLSKIVSMATNPGDLILDCFAGSGTTLAVAKQLKRGYLGIELDDKYYDLILSRLQGEADKEV